MANLGGMARVQHACGSRPPALICSQSMLIWQCSSANVAQAAYLSVAYASCVCVLRVSGWRGLLDGAEGQAAYHLLLGHPAEDQDRRDGERGSRGQLGPEQPLRTGEGRDVGGQRRGVGGGQVQAPERLVPAQDHAQQTGGSDARQGQRQQQYL